ncbi:hypothetical protein PRIPAC_85359 [Pristionchus pacificus]|uniref:N-acetyltransferase domain-containing protein n=1 Tax=Pristionchus pacificus TaxID=54126 RepID=A0A2A6BNI3_PRIPA|nr:hypothetical protein PRIPAC_85359 [Pristionchus pacificus]|eukprot:PDM67398.1 hypothetical protein PRIPAC_48815 [Pristionchus pacificus]
MSQTHPPMRKRMAISAYTLVDEGTDLLWKQFQDLVREMQWTSDDNTVLGLTPVVATTRCVFAQKNDDGSFLGCVVWNEYDEMAFIGFYIVTPVLRKCGLGSVLWARAMTRIRETGRIIGLRAVPEMAPRYASKDTPVEISRLRKALLSCAEMREFCDRYPTSSLTLKLASDLSNEEKIDLLRFDREISGRDRCDLLVPYLSCPRTEGAVLLNGEGKIVAIAGMTSTGFEKDNLFKLAPMYASSLDEVATLSKALLPFCERFSPDARILVHILTGTVGEKELEEAIGHSQNIELVTLFSSPIDNRLNTAKCYAPHNNSVHYDG